MEYGYCRISTPKQNLERQIRNIKTAFPNAIIFTETFTGKTLDRPKFRNLLDSVHTGDTIIFDEISRMSRDAEEGYKTYEKLYSQGVNLVFIKVIFMI